MKKYSRVFRYMVAYKRSILLYFVFILCSVLFSIVSIGMLMPFLQLIFTNPKPECASCSSIISTSSNSLVQSLNTWLQQFMQSDLQHGKLKVLGIICALMLTAIIFKNLFLYLAVYILTPVKNKVNARLKSELFEKVLQLPIGYFTETRKGDIISRIQNDTFEVEASVVGTVEGWIRDPMSILVTLVTLFSISFHLTAFVLVFIPIMGLIIGRLTKSLRKISKDVAEKHGETMSTVDETLGGLRVIKAFNAEGFQLQKYLRELGSLIASKIKVDRRRDLASPVSEVLGVMIFCIILGYGGYLVINNKIALDGASFLGFLGIFYLIIAPAKALSSSFSYMQKGTAAIDRIEEILQAPIAVDANENGKKLTQFEAAIEFKDLNFSYEDIPILKNINITIKKGKTIALVGSSGAGKSTLADLLPRFHDATGGKLLVDGIDVRDYSVHSLRSQMSIVTQEPILFNDTIANNIALGTPNASMEDIIAAAKIANAHQFISLKEEGYLSNVGDRGSKLSGGERQRVTIARAVLKNPPILILDEATSSLDTESERLVQDAINNLMSNRTSIVIAHRLSTIRNADEIIVLQKGEIVERGTHDSLIEQGGFYNKLVEMQEVK